MAMRRKHIIIAGLAGGVGVGILIVLLALAVDTIPSKTSRPPSSNQQNKPDHTPKMLRIQNATPIPVLEGDYTSPSHPWALVNKKTSLSPAQYKPDDLIRPDFPTNTTKSEDEQSIRALIKTPAENLFTAAAKQGHDIFMASGFRSYELQEMYFNNYVRTSGEEAAAMYSARPGQSEHQTGLAFDISLTSRECYLEACFADTAAGKWLAAHAHEYGFVIRYPTDKVAITQYQYEPWHFRYVGVDLASVMHEKKLVLEEVAPSIAAAYKD